jgi:hypothetical protein
MYCGAELNPKGKTIKNQNNENRRQALSKRESIFFTEKLDVIFEAIYAPSLLYLR